MDRDTALAGLKPHIRDYAEPTDVLVETTTRCNLDCSMCPHGGLEREQGSMSRETWTHVVTQIAREWPKTRVWPAIMGEPLLRGRELFEMIDEAKTVGVASVCLNTNLLGLATDRMDDLLACGVDRIFVGVDAASAQTYERIRRGGDFAQLQERLRLLLDARQRRRRGPRIALQFVVQEENEHEEAAFVESWKSAGYDVELKIRPRVGWSYGVESAAEVRRTASVADRIPCLWLLRQMAVFWNGDVPRCDADYEGNEIFGNVRETSLTEIWRKLGVLRRRHLGGDFSMSPCAGCDDWAAGRSETIECRAAASCSGSAERESVAS